MNFDKVKRAAKNALKILLKIGLNSLKTYALKLAVAIILPAGLIEHFQGIISLFTQEDNMY